MSCTFITDRVHLTNVILIYVNFLLIICHFVRLFILFYYNLLHYTMGRIGHLKDDVNFEGIIFVGRQTVLDLFGNLKYLFFKTTKG
jgi:hypothetical protein